MRFIARIDITKSGAAPTTATTSTTAPADFRKRLAAMAGFAVHHDSADMIIATSDGPSLACGTRGLILGNLFRRGEQHAIAALTEKEQAAIIASRGQFLIEACWGPYVAFLDHPVSGLLVIRAPWGDLPCYRFERDGVTFLASDIDLLVTCADYRPRVAWDGIAAQLVHGPFHHHASCLDQIDHVPGGERWSITTSGEIRETLWSPWTYAAPDRQIGNEEAASDLIRRMALECVNARASLYGSVLVTLSGGLDSSIVAACLAKGERAFAAMTLVTRDAIGDESAYAQQVCNVLGARLLTRLREVSRVDITRSGAQGRPFPCVRGFLLESMRHIDEAAQATGADAVFNGAGGDNIFCFLQSGAPAADRLLAEGLTRGFLRTVSAISQLAPASIAAVSRDAIARAWLGKPAFRLHPRLDLLTKAAQRQAGSAPDHPWLAIPKAIPPGKAFQTWLLAHCKNHVETLDPQSRLPVIAPLLSQPLVEACLSIPTWMWFKGGLNRVIARQAFAGMLPADTLLRRSKGTPGSFNFEIFETHRTAIRAMLAEGQLARQGMIDLPGTLRILDDPRPQPHANVERILDFLDIEAWAAGW